MSRPSARRDAQGARPRRRSGPGSLGGASGITLHLREGTGGTFRTATSATVVQKLVENGLEPGDGGRRCHRRCHLTVKPKRATLVPERREELTTEAARRSCAPRTLFAERLIVCWLPASRFPFVDPDDRQIETAKHRRSRDPDSAYSEARGEANVEFKLELLSTALDARQCELRVHMGHGLDYSNVHAITHIAGLEELNIGHSIVSRAVLVE